MPSLVAVLFFFVLFEEVAGPSSSSYSRCPCLLQGDRLQLGVQFSGVLLVAPAGSCLFIAAACCCCIELGCSVHHHADAGSTERCRTSGQGVSGPHGRTRHSELLSSILCFLPARACASMHRIGSLVAMRLILIHSDRTMHHPRESQPLYLSSETCVPILNTQPASQPSCVHVHVPG